MNGGLIGTKWNHLMATKSRVYQREWMREEWRYGAVCGGFMKRLCVFYYRAHEWLGKRVQWIVCRECQRRLQRGHIFHVSTRP